MTELYPCMRCESEVTDDVDDEDFEVWLADFREVTADCKWTDQQRAQWFSWFLSGAAKSTWQRTLRKEEKSHGRILYVFTRDIMVSTWNHALPISAAMS